MTHIEQAEALLKRAQDENSAGNFEAEAELITLAGAIASVGILKTQERTNYLLETLINAQGEQVQTSWKILSALQGEGE